MHENRFTVSMKDLEKGPVKLEVNTDAPTLELEDADFRFPGPITGEVIFTLARPRVVAKGTLNLTAVSQCVRCLQDAETRLAAPVDATYESEKEMREGRSEVVTTEEQVVTPYNGDWIQPEEELREAILLELPSLPLCKPDCKGLCPRCGANLNEETCSCENADEEVSPWKNALKGIKLESGE